MTKKKIKTTKVLDKGYVQLLNQSQRLMEVVKMARICYGSKGSKEADENLLKHLIKKEHDGVLEHVNFTFKIKCPMYIRSQWMRHRIGSFLERSGRYTFPLDCYFPKLIDKVATLGYKAVCESAIKEYNKLIAGGTLREQARGVLPGGMYTEFYWTVNMRSLINFMKLRTDEAAQREMRDYAFAVLHLLPNQERWAINSAVLGRKPKP